LNTFRDEFVDWYDLNRFIELEDYDATENVAAGYVMTQVNLTSRLTILGGVRYEHTKTSYDGNYGFLQGNLGEVGTINDTTGGQTYDDILPMVHLRYRFTPWLDLRLAATRTLSRPDYFNLVPYERINFAEQTIARGNPAIRRTTVWNYDAFLSFYSNDVGLITLGGFYKKLQDIDYLKQARIVGGQFNAYQLTEPVNGGDSEVWGFEVDLQTNLRNLPEPFNGIVINANYSYIRSETEFPFFEIGPRSPDPPYSPQIIDTFRKGTLPGQADHVGNFSLGYDRGGFSGRLSVTYQGRSLQTVGARAELDGYSDRYWRWDLTFAQHIFSNLSVFANWSNISNSPEESFLGDVVYPTDQRYYGWTADLGIRFSL
jgi:TonB-dependent receptor